MRVSTGLIALLDDVAALAKVAAASLDDAAAQAVKVGGKATGIVIDDAAVTPRYVVGFAADRELPIIGKIALGSLKNKLLLLLPAALVLSFVAPWIVTPLLMIGGVYLCLEGFHKVMDLVKPHAAHHAREELPMALGPKELEQQKVESAIRTDFILSAEIMAISLAAVATAPLWLQAGLLAVVGVGMTALVYGAVAIIVKADDVGLSLARSPSALLAPVGRALVVGMPGFLKALSLIGMVAMLWVGGQILVHGAHELGWLWPEEAVKAAGAAAADLAPPIGRAMDWLTRTAIDAAIGLAVGAAAAPIAERAIGPAMAWVRARLLGDRRPA